MLKTARIALMSVALSALTLAVTPALSDQMPSTQLQAGGWMLWTDFYIFGICGSSCPDGAEESDYCCFQP